MTTAENIEDHQARCQPYMLRLRMIALDETGIAPTWQAVTEVVQATGAILAEAEAAGSCARAAAGPGAATFLGVRMSRLAAAANDAIAAAGEGDCSLLRRHLHRFEVLTSAIWTVQQAVTGPVHSRPR